MPRLIRRHRTAAQAGQSQCHSHRHPVVAGYDGSAASRNALAYAAGLARRNDKWLVIVRVWRFGALVPPPLTAGAQAERIRQIKAALADIDLTGLDVEIVPRAGDPAGELLRATIQRQADALVVGAPRRFRHLASLPARLVRRANCPAIVVP